MALKRTSRRRTVRSRKRRPRGLLGIHFVAPDPPADGFGKGATRPLLRRILQEVQPDYVQCDAKGPSGLALYPSRVGPQAPGLEGDPLRLWREVTGARRVGLFVRYSVLEDAAAARRGPPWARIGPQGRADSLRVSLLGPYPEERFLAHLAELIERYGVDGLWLDGAPAAVVPDFGPEAVRNFRRRTGVRRAPTRPSHKHWPALAAFWREGFREHLRRWVEAVRKRAADASVGAEGAFSARMPEPVSAGVDYLTAEAPPTDTVRAVRLLGRTLAAQGRPWDLRLWTVRPPDGGRRDAPGPPVGTPKTPAQVMQEAAVVSALGGGVCLATTLRPDGSVGPWQVDHLARVARFLRERRPFCQKIEPVAQVAVLLAGGACYEVQAREAAAWARRAARRRASRPASHTAGSRFPLDAVFLHPDGPALVPVRGLLDALLGLHWTVEVVMEHHLATPRFAAGAGKAPSGETCAAGPGPVVVVPEWPGLGPEVRARLLAYAAEGGAVVVVGPSAARAWAEGLGVTLRQPLSEGEAWLLLDEQRAPVRGPAVGVRVEGPAEGFGRLVADPDGDAPWGPAATVIDYGRGRLAAVYADLGRWWLEGASPVVRRLLDRVLRRLVPAPLVELGDEAAVDIVVGRRPGRLLVHLVNVGGPHADPRVETFERVPAIQNLEVRVRLPARPERVLRQPGNRHLPFHYRDGVVRVGLDRVEIHEILVLETPAEA